MTSDRKIKVCFMMTACKKSGPVQQMLNIIKYLDKDKFEAFLLTIYPEPQDGSSQLDKYLPYVKHCFAPTSKLDIILGRTKRIKEALVEIKPDVIHSLGVFPDFAISRLKKYPQIITLRNYIWDDYPAKFGKIQGMLLAKLHLYAMKHTTKTVACSKSLADIYKSKMDLNLDFIRNGVDVEQYTKPTHDEVVVLRKELKLPEKTFIFVYSGQIISRKNQKFLLEVFRESFKTNEVCLLLLGDGVDYEALHGEFGEIPNIDFRGNVDNVSQYLKACDAYISTSKSEGMPNGVLEAMATGLPVILSDIKQHQEIMEVNHEIGFMYGQGDKEDLTQKMHRIIGGNYKAMGDKAYKVAHEIFSARGMSIQYQGVYLNLVD